MKKILFVTLMASFCFTISCASKKKTIDADAVTVEKPVEAPRTNTKDKEMVENNNNQYSCLVAGDERTVVLNKANSKCTVEYTKSGDTKEVAWAKATPNICTDTFDKIRTNIETAGFKCGLTFDDIKKEEKPVDTAEVKKTENTEKNN